MKLMMLAAAGLAAATIAAPAFAQGEAPAVAATAAFTIDAPIETLMADQRAKAVVLANLPGIDQHPAYEQFKAISLKALQPFSQGMISEEMLTKIAGELAAIR